MNSDINYEEYSWDAIIIGTGIGGGTLGLKLAEAGKNVLFLEKGKSYLTNKDVLSGQYAEIYFPKIERPEPKHFEILQRAGRWSGLVCDTSGKKSNSNIPFVGMGTGGSSALYGMVMERFSPIDFRDNHNNEKGEASKWPISYNDLKPYYEEAERLYRVRGSVDPLRNENISTYMVPPDMIPANKEVFDFLSAKGFHPYQVPLACEFEQGCQNCQGFLCLKNCRNDSAKICISPAINQYGSRLLDICEVIKIETVEKSVSAVVCNWQDKTIHLRSKIVVLAAGALHTPALLLRSMSEQYPNGIANTSDQVGRNLMRHYIDIYAISVKQKPQSEDYVKQIAFNDLYQSKEGRLGTVQSFGKLPPPSIQVATVYCKLKDSLLPLLASIFILFRPLVEIFVSIIFTKRLILTSIMEDFPDRENRITISQKGEIAMNYRINLSERNRIKIFRKKIREALKPYSYILIKQADSNGRIAHVCGTCRFGANPENSVLNAMCQTHDLNNLFIVDSSFFPTSGGTNPALTIAANAIRVAEHINKTWDHYTKA